MTKPMSMEEALAEGYGRVRGDRSGHTARAHKVVAHVLHRTGHALSVSEVENWIRDQDEGREDSGIAEDASEDLEDLAALRLTRLSRLGLPESTVVLLASKGLHFIGDLQDRLEKGRIDLPDDVLDKVEGAIMKVARSLR